jgi:hypothetical protein
MRVEGEGRGSAPGADRPTAGFEEALARARARDTGSAATARRAERRRSAEPLPAARLAQPAASREDRTAPPLDAGRERCGDPAPVPEVAAIARAAPPLVAAPGPGGTPLALSFGPSLAVELREATAGVAVLLRPGPGLERAAEAELPRVVAALRVRGVSVARAEVGGRPGPVERGARGRPGGRDRAR